MSTGPERRTPPSRSDLVIGIGGPLVGLLALVAGLATSDLGLAVIGAVALLAGLLFAVPAYRAWKGPQGPPHEGS